MNPVEQILMWIGILATLFVVGVGVVVLGLLGKTTIKSFKEGVGKKDE